MRRRFSCRNLVLLTVMAAVFSLFSLLNCSPAEAASFKDLGSGDQCLPYVNYLVSKDVVKGFPDGTFQPGGTVTRAQMAQMLTKAQALSAATGPALNFTDVGPNHWAYQTISQAVQSGYIAGYPDGTFRPEAPATRAEMAAMLLRLTRAQMPELTSPSSVTDLNGHWAAQPAAVALDAGLISLDAAGKFAPDKPASRAEVAKGLALMLTLNPEQNQVELSAALIPVKGKVQIVKANGTVIEATTTTPCGKGDTVITGSNSTAQLQFPDGSGFKINENSRLTIKEAMGRAAILPDGKEGVMIDNLEVELPEGQIFGALASTYQNSAVEDSSNAAVLEQPIRLASLQLPDRLAVTKQANLPWYKESSRKKVRVKVDMPWGVAAVRGTFWMNEVRNGRITVNAATGEVEVTAAGQTVAIGPGQSTAITSSSQPPAPPAPMPPQQQQLWNLEQTWVQETAGQMESRLPLSPQPLGPNPDTNGISSQILDNIQAAVPSFGQPPGNSGSSHSGGGQPSTPADQVAAPTASPAAGTYDSPQMVSLTSATAGATIYYTTDGSDPKTSDNKIEYSTAINISTTTTVKAYAKKANMIDSAVKDFTYTINESNNLTLRLLELTRASVNSDGEQTSAAYAYTAHSAGPWLNSDGRYVVFYSSANNLVEGDTNNNHDIFVKDTISGKVVRVSVTSDGVQGNGAISDEARITPDGRFVVFRSGCTNLATGNPAGDTNSNWDIFVHDRDVDGNGIFDEAGQIKTIRVSVTNGGQQTIHSNFGNNYPSISNDARFICFSSDASNLVAGDTNGLSDTFVYDRDPDQNQIYDEAGAVTVTRVNVSNIGAESDQPCYFPEMSGNGRYVVFSSEATTLVPDQTDFGIYLHDIENGTTSWLTKGSNPQISSDGRYIAFESFDSDQLDPTDNNQYSDIYMLDRTTGDIKRISTSNTGEQPNAHCHGQRISPDGRFVTFYSEASNLVFGDTNECSDVFIYDRQNQVLKRLSTTPDGIEGNLGSFEISPVSASGYYVAFTSEASNLVAGDTNNEDDVFLARFNPNAPADSEPPSAPAPLTPEAGLNWVELSWEEALDNIGIARYAVYQALNSDGPFTSVANVDGVTTSCLVGSLDQNTTYYYCIKAADSDGNWSEPSAVITVQTQSAGNPNIEGKKAAANYGHTAFIKSDGSLWTCGDNNYGQLGDGTYDDKYTPTAVKLNASEDFPADAAEVAAGYRYTAALRSDGTVWAWGYNNYGQLGDGTTTNHLYPIQVKGPDGVGFLDGVIAIAAGFNHTLALRSDGTVWAWGSNNDGALGNGNSEDSHFPVAVLDMDGQGSLGHITAIAAGLGHSLALDEDGTVYAWGANGLGQLGQGSTDYQEHSRPAPVLANGGSMPLSGITAIAAQDYCSMALAADGHVWTWGDSYTGQLGNGTDQSYSSLPVQVVKGASPSADLYLEDVVNIAVGSCNDEGMGLAVRSDGTVWAWGYNNDGELGSGLEVYSSNIPVQVITGQGPLTDAVEVASGAYHSIARTANGFYTWGYNWCGQLGDGTTTDRPLAQLIPENSESPAPSPNWITIVNNATGNDEVTVDEIPPGTVANVYDGNGNVLGSGTAEILGGDGYFPAHIPINNGFAPNLTSIVVKITEPGKGESQGTIKDLPLPVMDEGTDFAVDNCDHGYGCLTYIVTEVQKNAMEAACGKTIATIKAYTTPLIETTFNNLTEAEATGGVSVPAGDLGAAIASDPGCYGYAIAAYDAAGSVVAQYISDYWEVVESGLSRTPGSVTVSANFDRTFTLTAYASAGTFKTGDLNSYVTLEGSLTGLNKTVTRISDNQIEVNITGNLSQTGYGKICIAGEAFVGAPEPGGGVRQVASVLVN